MDFTYSCSVKDANNITLNISSVVDEAGTTNIYIKLADSENEILFTTNKCNAKKIADMIRQIASQNDSCGCISTTSVSRAVPL